MKNNSSNPSNASFIANIHPSVFSDATTMSALKEMSPVSVNVLLSMSSVSNLGASAIARLSQSSLANIIVSSSQLPAQSNSISIPFDKVAEIANELGSAQNISIQLKGEAEQVMSAISKLHNHVINKSFSLRGDSQAL